MTPYLIWIPCVIAVNVTYAILSQKNNIEGGKWFLYTFIFGALFQVWPFISKFSSNILLDALIFDIIIIITFIVTMYLLGASSKFGYISWIGVVLSIIGILMIKLEEINQ